jgi:hypothetical protein
MEPGVCQELEALALLRCGLKELKKEVFITPNLHI